MNRKQLLDALSDVRPAMASTSLIQVLTHLCFTGDEVFAYDDQIGISAPCSAAGFAGAVPGATLLALLAASGAAEVDLTVGDGELAVKLAGARARLPLLPPDSFLFEMPEVAEGDELPVSADEFVVGVKGCLRSVSPDTSVPDQLGVTIIPKKKSVDMYSINGASMSHAQVALKATCPLKRRVVLSAPFCEQVVRLAGAEGKKKPRLVVAEDHALLSAATGTRVFGKLVDVPKPLDFEAQFGEIVPADFEGAAVNIPKTMRMAVERALIISDPSGERVYTRLSISGGVLAMQTESGRGKIGDRMRFSDHPDVEVSADAQWLKVGVSSFDKILVTEGGVIFSRPGELYLVATSS